MTVMLPEFRLNEEAMHEYCERRGATLLRVLQEARGGTDACSGVFLAIDADGIVKVFKEELPHKDAEVGATEKESEVHARLEGLPFFPRLYGVEDFGGISVMRQSVAYGQELQAWLDAGVQFAPQEVRSIMGRVAGALAVMHERGVLHQDIRPANIRIDGDALSLIDVGDGRICKAGKVISATPSDPVYAPPETASQGQASVVSDVFQLGAVGRQLADRRAFQYAQLNSWIDRMVNPDPNGRPSAASVASGLGETGRLRIHAPRGSRRTLPDAGIVLFPARMGIPHQGHVDFIARVMELGFPVIISLQRSYTITDRDPLPKWQVMKMVAASLVEKGFVPDQDFSFVFTPLFGSDEAHRMHFAMMPGMDRVVAVASGNPDVQALFPELPFIDQRAVFGHEGEDYLERSWGEGLRDAVRLGVRGTFSALAASGVEKVLSFAELRRDYAAVQVEFVRGSVTVVVIDGAGNEAARGRALRYLAPQQSAVRHLAATGLQTRVTDLYARDTAVEVDGVPRVLRDAGTTVDAEGNVEISFALV